MPASPSPLTSTPARTLPGSATLYSVRAAVTALLFFSGAIALVYESVWQRQFALLFGSAAPATAALLGAYFAGMGLGAWFGAKRTRAYPLRTYAVLELAVGASALVVTPMLAGLGCIYPAIYSHLAAIPIAFVGFKLLAAFAAILLPTFCMGATLPVLSDLVASDDRHLGIHAGQLYVANTAGAAIGAVLFPFFLLPRFGSAGTVALCACGNLMVAATALYVDRRQRTPTLPVRSGNPKSSGARARPLISGAQIVPVHAGAFISGFVSFALQVLWNRAFAQVHENSMASFSMIAAIYIVALAVGGQAARSLLYRGVRPRRLMGAAWIVSGTGIILGPFAFLRLSDGLAFIPNANGWLGYILWFLRISALVILPQVLCLGVALPTLMESVGAQSRASAGAAIGRLLGINIIGSVIGAWAAGFILPSFLGIWPSIFGSGVLLILAGVWLGTAWRSLAQRNLAGALLIGAGVVCLWPILRVNLPRVRVDRDEHVLALREGAHGIAAVVEGPGSRRLKLNNHYTLGGTASTGDERMQAHIPLLLHPSPNRVAFLGCGTGITAGGALFHPVKEITVLELVPEVIELAKSEFHQANNSVLTDPRTRVVREDARNFLRGSREKFDVIISDLVVPWRQGEGALFTAESFQAVRDSLAPGGLYCQWVPLFQLTPTEAVIVCRTFVSVFPHAQVWRGDFSPSQPALALIGSAEELQLLPEAVRARLAEMTFDPTNPQLRYSETFWMNYMGGIGLAPLPRTELRLNREDRPWIELLGMRHAVEPQIALLTGRALQPWLATVAQEPHDSTANLPHDVRNAIKAGPVLAEFTLCLSEENDRGAREAQSRLRELVSAEAYRALFPE